MTTIKVRKGLNGYPLSVCKENGRFIANFNSYKEIRSFYKVELKEKAIKLKKETCLEPI